MRSTEWSFKAVEKCWTQKKMLRVAGEMAEAEKTHEHARAERRKMLVESAGNMGLRQRS